MLEEKIGNNVKLKLYPSLRGYPSHSSYNIKVTRLKNNSDDELEEIGHADVSVHNKVSAEWLEIIIAKSYRNKGIGSKVVKFMIDYLKSIGVKEVLGIITEVDDVERAANFWKKHGFSVEKHDEESKTKKISLFLSQNEKEGKTWV